MLSGGIIFCVKTVLLILFEGFTSILLFVGFFPSRIYCFALDWEMERRLRLGIGIVVLPWEFFRTELGIAVLPWL